MHHLRCPCRPASALACALCDERDDALLFCCSACPVVFGFSSYACSSSIQQLATCSFFGLHSDFTPPVLLCALSLFSALVRVCV
jgi:hypothetical protein